MNLLFDENVSPRLAEMLAVAFPGSAHVRDAGLRGSADPRIWEHARASGFTIVSKDPDFRERAIADGSPPRVIWLDVGNAGTREIVALLLRERLRIERFGEQRKTSVLALPLGTGSA